MNRITQIKIEQKRIQAEAEGKNKLHEEMDEITFIEMKEPSPVPLKLFDVRAKPKEEPIQYKKIYKPNQCCNVQ